MKIWFVDDRQDNLNTWLYSFPKGVVEENEFKTLLSVAEIINEFENHDLPDIVFLDFFISGKYGSDVIHYLIKNEIELPLLIAHSSMDRANEGLLKIGAHLKLEKNKGTDSTLSISSTIKNTSDLEKLIEQYKK